MPDFFEVLGTRRSVRSYTSQPVTREDIQALIDDAILAPSAMNLQPWAFTVVTSRAVMQKLNAIVVAILRSAEAQAQMTEGIKEAVNAPGYDVFYGAPVLIVIQADSKLRGTPVDCQLAMENLLLSAHAKGLGACYVGSLLYAAEVPEARQLLGIPERFRMAAAAIVGHPGTRPEGPPLRNPARVHWID